MRTFQRSLVLLLSTVLFSVSFMTACDGAPAHIGTYETSVSFEFEWNNITHTVDLTAQLTLKNDNTYRFQCTERFHIDPCYTEEGNYTLANGVITFVPTACQDLTDDGKSEMITLTPDQQESMKKTGTLENKTVAANMRWNDSVWELTNDFQLAFLEESEAPAASKEHEAAKGTYGGQFDLELTYGSGMVSSTNHIRAKLILDAAGTYTFYTGHLEYRNMTYCETGTYTLSGEEITLIPDECMYMIKGGAAEMRALSPEDQTAMTTKGTLKDGVVTATMRWLYNQHQIASEMELAYQDE